MFEPSRLDDVMQTIPERKERKKKKAKKRAQLRNYNVRFGIKPNVKQMPVPIQKFNIRQIFQGKFPQYYLHDVAMNRRAQSANFGREEAVEQPRPQRRRAPPNAPNNPRGRAPEELVVDLDDDSVTSADAPPPPELPRPFSVDSSIARSNDGLSLDDLLASPGEIVDSHVNLSEAFETAREQQTDDIYRTSVDDDVDDARPVAAPSLGEQRPNVAELIKRFDSGIYDHVKQRTARGERQPRIIHNQA